MNWHDLLPSEVADQQIAWERGQMCARVHATGGVTYKEMAEWVGVSAGRIGQLVAKAKIQDVSPAELYLNHWAPLVPHRNLGRVRYKIRNAAKLEAAEKGVTVIEVLHKWALQGVVLG